MTIVIVQPYKPRFSTYNAVDLVLVLLLVLWYATFVCINIANLKAQKWSMFFVSLSYIVAVLSLFYISFVTLLWMCSRRVFGRSMIERVHRWITENQRQMVATGSLKSLPDRLINPEEYEEDLTDPVTVYIKTNTSGHFSN